MDKPQRRVRVLLSMMTVLAAAGCASQSFSLPPLSSPKFPEAPPQAHAAQPAQPAQYVAPAPRPPMPMPVVKTTKVTATGQGTINYNDQMSDGQRHLMAQRAARVDAFRNLVEVIYGFKISGQTSVAAFVTKNDGVRSYIDSFMRGARVVNMTPMPNGIYEATVELELNNEFFDTIMAGVNTAPAPAPTSGVAGCVGQGCGQPSPFSFSTN